VRDAYIGGAGLVGCALGILVGRALVGRLSRRPRYVAVVVGRASGVTAALDFMAFRDLGAAQAWCRRMNVIQDWVTSLDTHPPGQTPCFFDVRAWPYKPEQEVR